MENYLSTYLSPGDLVKTYVQNYTCVYAHLEETRTEHTKIPPNHIGLVVEKSGCWIRVCFSDTCGWISDEWIVKIA